MPGKTIEIATLLNRLPDLEQGKMPPVDVGLADELTRKLLAGGEALALDLVSGLGEVDNGGDWKARFLLHTLVMAVGAPERAASRGMLGGLLLEESIGERPAAVRVFLLSQLRFIADGVAVPKLVGLLGANTREIVDAAAIVLGSIGKEALPSLRKAHADARGPLQDVIANAVVQIENR